MKNQDGIVIKPRQVWVHENIPRKVLIVDGGEVVYRNLACSQQNVYSNLPLDARFNTLTTSHDGADLDAARKEGWLIWVEGMECLPGISSFSDWAKFEAIECFEGGTWGQPCDGGGVRGGVQSYEIVKGKTYRYKLKREDKRGSEQPLFRRFEIDWSSNSYPCLRQEGSGITFGVGLWLLIGDYRIFGFVDSEEITELAQRNIHSGIYCKSPCDHTGNRKYAIGRLEK